MFWKYNVIWEIKNLFNIPLEFMLGTAILLLVITFESIRFTKCSLFFKQTANDGGVNDSARNNYFVFQW